MREFFHRHQAWPASFFEEQLALTYSKILTQGDSVVDVGAHTGFHSQRFSSLIGSSGHLVCVEPIPEIHRQLQRNMLEAEARVEFFEGVLSDRPGTLDFLHVPENPGESGLKERKKYGVPEVSFQRLSVIASTLDDIAANKPNLRFVKIDTEGAELSVLAGATRVLAGQRPVISVEWGYDTYSSFGHQAIDLWNFARQNSYSLFDLFTNMVTSAEDWRDVSDRGSWDFIMVPDEKIAWYVYSLAAVVNRE